MFVSDPDTHNDYSSLQYLLFLYTEVHRFSNVANSTVRQLHTRKRMEYAASGVLCCRSVIPQLQETATNRNTPSILSTVGNRAFPVSGYSTFHSMWHPHSHLQFSDSISRLTYFLALTCTSLYDALTIFFFFFPPYFVHLTGRRHLRSAASGKLYVQQTATAIGRRNFAVSGPETWNSLPAELRLSTLSTATFAWRLKAHLFVSTEWHVPAARLILLKAALVINIIIILCGPCNNWHYLGHIKHVDNDDDDDDQFARTNIHAPQGSQMHNNSALNELTTVTQCELTLTRLLRPSAVPVAPSVAAT